MELLWSRFAAEGSPVCRDTRQGPVRHLRDWPAGHALPGTLPAIKTVLLVHKAPRTGSPVTAALEARGYRVIPAGSVEEAFEVWSRLAVRVDLFMADISLGRDHRVEQLLGLLQVENPRMRVLYANDLEQPTAPLMAAPGYPQQLAGIVDNCLGR